MSPECAGALSGWRNVSISMPKGTVRVGISPPRIGACPRSVPELSGRPSLEPFDFRVRGPPLKNGQNQSNEDYLGHFWFKVVPGAFPGVPRPVTGSSPSLISLRNTVSEPVRLDFTRGIQCLSCPGASFTREIQCLTQSWAGFPRKNKCLAMARGLFPRRNVGGA